MTKKIVLGLGLVAMVAFSGCSDTKESLEKEKKELEQKYMSSINDCMNGKKDKDECDELEKELKPKIEDLKARMKALEENHK